jgi:hypothetical protein
MAVSQNTIINLSTQMGTDFSVSMGMRSTVKTVEIAGHSHV